LGSLSIQLGFCIIVKKDLRMKIFRVWIFAFLAVYSSVAQADIFFGSGFTLVDNGTAFGNIVIAGNGGTVASIDSVTINGFTHTYIGDLFVEFRNVTTATAITVSLASPPDNTPSNFNGNYTFSVNTAFQTIDEAAFGQGDSFNIASGSYAISDYGGGTANGARTNFNTMTNLAIDGTWQLRVIDFASVDTGAITSWSFNSTITAVPEPSSIALIGGTALLGGFYRFRRRKLVGVIAE